jgi:hypothetical protein
MCLCVEFAGGATGVPDGVSAQNQPITKIVRWTNYGTREKMYGKWPSLVTLGMLGRQRKVRWVMTIGGLRAITRKKWTGMIWAKDKFGKDDAHFNPSSRAKSAVPQA